VLTVDAKKVFSALAKVRHIVPVGNTSTTP